MAEAFAVFGYCCFGLAKRGSIFFISSRAAVTTMTQELGELKKCL
jgi:hypothetical protein